MELPLLPEQPERVLRLYEGKSRTAAEGTSQLLGGLSDSSEGYHVISRHCVSTGPGCGFVTTANLCVWCILSSMFR